MIKQCMTHSKRFWIPIASPIDSIITTSIIHILDLQAGVCGSLQILAILILW